MARKGKTDNSQATKAPEKEEVKEVISESQGSSQPLENKETEKITLDTQETTKAPENEGVKEENLPEYVTRLMRLYPQYEKLWISEQGFVHPEATPKYMRGDAMLYTNIFFNNKN